MNQSAIMRIFAIVYPASHAWFLNQVYNHDSDLIVRLHETSNQLLTMCLFHQSQDILIWDFLKTLHAQPH